MAKRPKSKNEVSKVEGIRKVNKFKVKKKMASSGQTLKKNKQSFQPSGSSCGHGDGSLRSQIQQKQSSIKVQSDAGKVPMSEASQQSPQKPSSNQTLSNLSKTNSSEIITKTNGCSTPASQTLSAGKHKRRKGSKKAHDGISNWASLCSKLKIDPTRKSKPLKAQEVTDAEEKPSEPIKSKPDIWFDNVDKFLIEGEPSRVTQASEKKEGDADDKLVKPDSYKGVTQCVAMDCEMVGIGHGGEESILARVSIVNHFGVCLYDKFVLPREKVTDYRTHVSGVTKENLSTGEEFTKVQKEVSAIIRGKILVGHALHNDLKVLFLTHPHKMIRDTSKYKPFRQLFKGGIPSLKKLADKILGVSVQEGQHSSIQDAQATMRLYTLQRQRWEKELRQLWKQDKKKLKKKVKTKQGKQTQS